MPSVKPNELSDRELDILKLVATGASNKEIASQLFISMNTVKVHLRNIFGKIGATSRTEAAMYAVRLGLVETTSSQVSVEEEFLIDQDYPGILQRHSGTTSQELTLPKSQYNFRRIFPYLVLFGGLLALFLLMMYFDNPGIINLANSTLAPTSTPRIQWFQLPGLPIPRWGLAVTNYENQIYAIGGENADGISNVIEKYDPQVNIWTELTTKPTPVTDINAVVIGGVIYIPGGRLASGLPTDITEIYDPHIDQWSSGTPLPKPISSYALTVYEGRMYLFGGWDGNQVVNDAYVYDTQTNIWSEIPSMPTARSSAGAVVVGGKIYIIGGWDGNQALSICEVLLPDFSGEGSPWIQAPHLPSGRYGMGITNLADIIFVIGGMGTEANLTTIALSSDDADWGQLQSPLQSGWTHLGAATIGTRLYVLGGKHGEIPMVQMWSYQAIFTITLPIIR